jgi:large subunit ribosomal protein L18
MGNPGNKLRARERRRRRVRVKVRGTLQRPRLSVFRSAKHVYAQVIDDVSNRVLASASSVTGEFRSKGVNGGNVAGATLVGEILAGKAKERGIQQVVFDRNGFLYHGRVKAVAAAARDGGLEF